MRTFRLLLNLVVVLLALSAASCQPDSPADVVDTSTSVTFPALDNNLVLNVDGKGGQQSISYVINNGIDGIDIVASTDVEWISDVVATSGTLTFNVAENLEAKARETKIRITYPNVDAQYILIKQSQFDAITFKLELTASTSTSCTTLITPSNEDYAYIAYMAEVDYFLMANITTAEELFQDDYNYYMAFAKQWEAPLLKEFFLMNYIAYQGEYSIDWTGMMPGKEYVLYGYDIEFNEENTDYRLASPVTYQLVTLQSDELMEVDFDVDIAVNGPNVTYNIKPQNYHGRY